MKKAQGITMETIVIAALVVIVLVVSVIIYNKYVGGIKAMGCEGAQNPDTKCVPGIDNCKDAEGYKWMPMMGLKCPSDGDMCCKKIVKIS